MAKKEKIDPPKSELDASSAPEPLRPAVMPRKKTASQKKRPATIRKRVPSAKRNVVQPTEDAIRLRAYFIAERRMQLSLPGDSDHDWLEARRQLLEEAGLE